MPEWPQPVRTTRPWPRTQATSAWSSRISGSGCQVPSRCASWPGNPRSNSVVRSTSPVTSNEPSSRNDGCLLLDDVKAGALKGALARRRQLHRLAPGNASRRRDQNSGWMSTGMLGLPSCPRQPVHAGDMVPVAVAEDDDVDVAGSEVEPAHVLHQPVGRAAGVEEHAGLRSPLVTVTSAEKPCSARSASSVSPCEQARRHPWRRAIDGRFAGPWSASSESVTLSTSVVIVTGRRARAGWPPSVSAAESRPRCARAGCRCGRRPRAARARRWSRRRRRSGGRSSARCGWTSSARPSGSLVRLISTYGMPRASSNALAARQRRQ